MQGVMRLPWRASPSPGLLGRDLHSTILMLIDLPSLRGLT
jgi:hypothetical protein